MGVRREPKLGEMLQCAICYCEISEIDQEWIDWYNQKDDKRKEGLYSFHEDCFLGYDGCESE